MTALAYTPPAGASRAKRLFLYSPLARIVLFGVTMVLLVLAVHGLVVLLGWQGKQLVRPEVVTGIVLQQVVPAVLAYFLLVRWIERRRPAELLPAHAGRHVAVGAGVGVLYISTTMAVLALAGSYTVSGFNDDVHWVGPLLVAGIGAAVSEELIFRGVLFRIVEEGLGTWAALVVSALFFGGVHLGNPNATLWSSIAIAVEAGLLLGMIYQVTRSLPLCMGVHAAWNFTLGTVYGGAVSGHASRNSWLAGQYSGADWLTGGAFGIEASVVSVAVGAGLAVALMVYAVRRGTIVPWRGRRRAPIAMAPDNPSVTA